MATALNNLLSLERRRARYESERLAHEETAEEPVSASSPQVVESSVVPTPTSSGDDNTSGHSEENASLQDRDAEEGQVPAGSNIAPENEEVVAVAAAADNTASEEDSNVPTRAFVTLAELQEERELARRRSSACVLFAAFVLFRLWVEVLDDFTLASYILCIVATSWTIRWIRFNREQEEELDRRIAAYSENSENGNSVIDRNELRMLSFQAQLALAIMESQRQMMQGGYHPEAGQSSGVSESARSKWERFKYDDLQVKEKKCTGGEYNSVPQEGGKDQKVGLDEEPQCSICLSEYEIGEALVRLPCGHMYHEECIASWTSNHTKCPLCNVDLESIASNSALSSNNESSSIV